MWHSEFRRFFLSHCIDIKIKMKITDITEHIIWSFKLPVVFLWKKKFEETFISANNPYFNMLGNHNLALLLIINPRIVKFFNLS